MPREREGVRLKIWSKLGEDKGEDICFVRFKSGERGLAEGRTCSKLEERYKTDL